ncbi:hypothetical protein AVEN_185787-1 [Araneus ventricosus]|uniref:RNase H type-1 domain-containing protein n=1 Tax=Araneus ventricosus TaxID=182803 RepID=A0A4Y2HIK1_ARAVE|nr:hypothetical protein AVEN_185787-1 [Araneus ventricosus]
MIGLRVTNLAKSKFVSVMNDQFAISQRQLKAILRDRIFDLDYRKELSGFQDHDRRWDMSAKLYPRYQVHHNDVEASKLIHNKKKLSVAFRREGTINAAGYCDTFTKLMFSIPRKRPRLLSRRALFLDDIAIAEHRFLSGWFLEINSMAELAAINFAAGWALERNVKIKVFSDSKSSIEAIRSPKVKSNFVLSLKDNLYNAKDLVSLV